jgi:hypothetical protein
MDSLLELISSAGAKEKDEKKSGSDKSQVIKKSSK